MFWFPNNKFKLSPPPENSISMNMHVSLWCANIQPSAGCTLLFTLWRSWGQKQVHSAKLKLSVDSFPPSPALGMLNSFKDLLGYLIFKSYSNSMVQCKVQWNCEIGTDVLLGDCLNQVIRSFPSPGNTKSVPFLWISSLGPAEWSQLVLPEKSKVWEGREMPFQPCRHP